MKPQSITNFDRFYLGALAVGLFNTVINWSDLVAAPEVAESGLGSGFFLISMIIGYGISLLLWYFISARGSNVARWILVVLTVIGLVMMPFSLGTLPMSQLLLTIVGTVLQVAALVMLFRPDAKPWFEKNPPVDPATFE